MAAGQLYVVIRLILVLDSLLHGLFSTLYFLILVLIHLVHDLLVLLVAVHARLLVLQLLQQNLPHERATRLSDANACLCGGAYSADEAVVLGKLFEVVERHEVFQFVALVYELFSQIILIEHEQHGNAKVVRACIQVIDIAAVRLCDRLLHDLHLLLHVLVYFTLPVCRVLDRFLVRDISNNQGP